MATDYQPVSDAANPVSAFFLAILHYTAQNAKAA